MASQFWDVECPHCRETCVLTEWASGTKVVCPCCKKQFLLLNEGEESPLEIRQRELKEQARAKRKEANRTIIRRMWMDLLNIAGPFTVTVAVLVILALGFAGPPLDVLHYAGIAAVIVFVAWKFSSRRPRTESQKIAIRAIACAAIIVCCGVRGYFATVTEFSVKHGNDGRTTEYEDTLTRFGNKPVYRTVTILTKEGKLDVVMEGPLSPDSGKPHGKWKYLAFNPIDGETWWYWYGDQVTEGEWHLRNNGR